MQEPYISDNNSVHFKLPAAHLLLGEYFVTQSDFTALSFASEPQASCHINYPRNKSKKILSDSPEHASTLILTYENQSQSYTFDRPKLLPPLIVLCLKHTLAQSSTKIDHSHIDSACKQISALGVSVHIDTSPFFGTHKLGLGSSECAAVLATLAFFLLLKLNETNKIVHDARIPLSALKAHTEWQGGSGSGYGCYSSYYGGIAEYRTTYNFEQESWHGEHRRLDIKIPGYAYLYLTPHTTSSPQATKKWAIASKKNPLYTQKLKERISETIRLFTDEQCARDIKKFMDWLALARAMSEELGRLVALENTLLPTEGHPSVLQNTLYQLFKGKKIEYKSLGAGNELFLISSPFPIEDSLPKSILNTDIGNVQNKDMLISTMQDEYLMPLTISEGLSYIDNFADNADNFTDNTGKANSLAEVPKMDRTDKAE